MGKRVSVLNSTDQTGVGEGPFEEIEDFMPVMEGVTLTAPAKEDILGRLKLTFEQRRLTIPRDDKRLLFQITSQQCEPTVSGTLKFTHPPGTHDDCLWALALSVRASHDAPPPRRPVVKTRSFG